MDVVYNFFISYMHKGFKYHGLKIIALLPPFNKTFVVGPGHVAIPTKLVTKITSGQLMDLADLLSANLGTVEQEPQTFVDGKLLVSKKGRAVEIQDVLTLTEAFTIFQI